MDITITINDGRLAVASPYHPEFPPQAKALGGKWAGNQWVFDPRDEARVRDLCREIYGTDGSPVADTDLVTIRVTVMEGCELYEDLGAIFLAGREIARAFGRDGGARLGEGVAFLEGKPDSGGSRKNWMTVIPGPATFEVRDLPRSAAEKVLGDYKRGVQIALASEPDPRETLMAERERLLRRLAEIDALLDEGLAQ